VSEPALDARLDVVVGNGSSVFRLEVELRLEQGVLVLFGPSGSGKSLTLQAIVGVVRPASGHLRVRGRVLYDGATGDWVPPHKRRVGYVPQHHSLFPFCSVRENVAFGLPRQERSGPSVIVEQLLTELGLERLRDAHPEVLSGGERQRVALARALAVRPELLVLDEPFAAIDHEGRSELRAMLKRTLASHGTPAVFVTHDPVEAAEIGDRVVRFARGRTAEAGTPAEVLPGQRNGMLESSPARS
jgi:molybdate transport system ATP-binding protein